MKLPSLSQPISKFNNPRENCFMCLTLSYKHSDQCLNVSVRTHIIQVKKQAVRLLNWVAELLLESSCAGRSGQQHRVFLQWGVLN